MRVLLTTYDSRGGVEPLLALAAQLKARGADALVCAPPDQEFAQRAAGLGVPLLAFGDSVRAMSTAAPNASEDDVRTRVLGLIDAQFDAVGPAAQGCAAVVSTGLPWTSAGARSVADNLGVQYVYASYHPPHLPSPYHPPHEFAGREIGSDEFSNRVMWDLNARNTTALFGPTLNARRASIGLPPVSNVRDYAYTDRPWLAADPTLGPWKTPKKDREPADLGVVQTGAWLLQDQRPLPADLLEFLDAGTAPVYVGFGSMPLWGSNNLARTAVEAIRAHGRRAVVARGWADLQLTDDRDCFILGEVNHQALFGRVAAATHHGGAGTTTTAALAGVPQLVVPQGADQVYWARRVAELGIGTACDGPAPPFEYVSPALEVTLAPETRERATAVAGRIRADGAAVAATMLLDRLAR